ncbi:MAG: 30S ribosomal protein S18 [Candidatus Giovannonibacteria bacterium GW2011_GWA2_53_7]|uniref:Small ribosomal subunit protein bS18 n=1 Tax=Candidatus Giovannonibacteria bacterium GW2011_GWA2_53_7 TaxID=1618650 RepID=A0A0G2AW93_9BACT|nr:MAG: 30S ribosomal protein S18 [Candidatus Giovannonibacteria bacterium GW2011_GWA2_53_7]
MLKKKQQSYLAANNIKYIDYKDVDLIKMFLTPHGQIQAAKRTGFSMKEQRALALAVKRSRFMGFLPYITA